MVYVQKPLINTHTDMSCSEVRDLNLSTLYLVYTSSHGFGESADMPRLAEPSMLANVVSTNNLSTLYLVYTSSSGESSHMHRLPRAFTAD